MRIDQWMEACAKAYYATRDPFGVGGDFVTAPEISQMFGELLGAWAAQVWVDQGAPDPFVLAELGPGRGTLMRDALRAAAGMPGFRAAAKVWLVETSPSLRRTQAATLGEGVAGWAADVDGLPPEGPLIVLANEFFDALPVRQFQRTDALWRERQVELGPETLAFGWGRARGDALLDRRFPEAVDGTIVEVCEAGEEVAAALGRRVARDGGAVLAVDYGAWDGVGDTLQAVKDHVPVDPLAAPGEADLTAHVRFRALAEAAAPARAHGPVPQGVFLERLGIGVRAEVLVRAGGAAVGAAHRRLTDPDEMGNLFKVLAVMPGSATVPPGFSR